MPMSASPVNAFGFLITPEIAPYVHLAADKKTNNIPEEVKWALQEKRFEEMAEERGFSEDSDYNNPTFAKEKIETAYAHCDMAYASDFSGEANTIELPDDYVNKPKHTYEETYSDDMIVWQPLHKFPGLFNRPYAGPDELLNEVKETLHSLGIELPKTFTDADIMKHVVEIIGVTYN